MRLCKHLFGIFKAGYRIRSAEPINSEGTILGLVENPVWKTNYHGAGISTQEDISMTTSTTETSPALADVLAAERQAAADSLIKNYVITSTALGLIPLPLVDLAGFMALQIKLVHGLTKHYGVPFKENLVKSLVTSLISGAGSIIGVMGISSISKLVPGLGTLGGGASVAITAGAVTYAVGQVFVRHFESGGTLLDFDPKKMRDVFKRKLKEGEEVAQNLKNAEPPKTAAATAAS